jgi:alpha-glucosidase
VWVHSKWLRDPKARRALFARCHEIGIAGLKIDFFDHEHKEVIDLYQAILREAAENQLVLDFHGANKPTGESRTWPNEMVREAVRGLESRIADRATHETTLPFTRLLAGPAEYTPVVFGDRRGNTTVAHQIADAAIFSAPLMTYGAHPQNLLKSPAVGVIKSIPATWDETIVLPPSEIGQCVAMARRSGETWFLAVINGTEPRTVKLPLSFLDGGSYVATIVEDAGDKDAGAVNVHDEPISREHGALTVQLPAGGGFLARIERRKIMF